MLVDLHAHTGGISRCCRIDAEQVVKTAKEHGFDGLAVANHYTHSYFTKESYSEWIEKYIAEWNKSKKLGEKYGIRIFKAVEVTMEYEPRLHMLIYGADEDFLRSNPMLCEMSHRELYETAVKNSCAIVQAHPFRGGATVQDTALLHGVEINCHPLYENSYAERVTEEAKKTSLALTVGCDYHADTYRPMGGTYLPDSITNERELAEYILSSHEFKLRIHEPADGMVYDTVYTR